MDNLTKDWLAGIEGAFATSMEMARKSLAGGDKELLRADLEDALAEVDRLREILCEAISREAK